MIQAWAVDTRRRVLTSGWPYLTGAALAVFAVAEVLVRHDESGSRLLVSLLLAGSMTVPVGFLTDHWLASVAIVFAAFVSVVVEPQPVVAGVAGLVAALYHVGRRRAGWLAVALLVPFVVLTFGELVSASGPVDGDQVVSGPSTTVDEREPDRSQPSDVAEPALWRVLVTSVAVAATGLGRLQRSRSTEAELQAKEATFADELVAHTARGERARIARELHDVVAHRISAIAVQAETARLTTPDLSPEGARQLVGIGDSARDALAEMRRLLGVLRKDIDETTDRQPQPGISQIPQLVAEARDLTGATIRLMMSGRVGPLDPGVELTTYRVVQESLTNSRRHAPGSPVDVELTYGGETLRVQIRDVGPGSDATANGLGLLGMRERVAAVGGELSVESGSSGGFVVTATLPAVMPARTPVAPEAVDE